MRRLQSCFLLLFFWTLVARTGGAEDVVAENVTCHGSNQANYHECDLLGIQFLQTELHTIAKTAVGSSQETTRQDRTEMKMRRSRVIHYPPGRMWKNAHGRQGRMSFISTDHSSDNKSFAWFCVLAACTALMLCLVFLYLNAGGEDEKSQDRRKLFNGFVIYFADNVLTMLAATTAGTLGMTLFGSTGGIGPGGPQLITAQVLGILVNTCIALALYFFAASRHRAAHDRGDHELSHAFSHMLQALPWLIIVPAVNIPYTILDELVPRFQSDTHEVGLINALLVTAMVFLCLVLITAPLYSSRPDMGCKCESLPTFLLNSLNHSLLSCAGKSLHLVEYEIHSFLAGPKNKGSLVSELSEIIIMLIFTWFFLAHAWPRLSETTPGDKVFKSVVTTITVYAWAFSFISHLWDYFYYGVASGQVYYWAIMIVCLLVALIVAYASSNNFYGGPSSYGAAFGLMLCWTVDFGVWWAWSQVMTDIDNAVDPDGHAFKLGIANGAIMLGLLAVTSLIYRYGDPRSMVAAQASRVQHDHSLSEVSKHLSDSVAT